jgi:hypothetical protein
LRRHDRIVAIEGDRQSVLRRHGGDALDEVLLPGGAAVTAAFKVDLPCGAVDLGYLRTDYRGQIAVGVERALDPNALAELADVPVLLALAPGAIMGGVLVWLALSDVSVVPGPGGITLSDPGAYGPSPDEPPIVPASPLTTGLIGALALLAGLGSLGFALWLGLAGRLLPRPGAAEELGRGLPGPPRHRRPRQCPLEMAIDPQDRGARIGFPPQIVEALLDRLACARR